MTHRVWYDGKIKLHLKVALFSYSYNYPPVHRCCKTQVARHPFTRPSRRFLPTYHPWFPPIGQRPVRARARVSTVRSFTCVRACRLPCVRVRSDFLCACVKSCVSLAPNLLRQNHATRHYDKR